MFHGACPTSSVRMPDAARRTHVTCLLVHPRLLLCCTVCSSVPIWLPLAVPLVCLDRSSALCWQCAPLHSEFWQSYRPLQFAEGKPCCPSCQYHMTQYLGFVRSASCCCSGAFFSSAFPRTSRPVANRKGGSAHCGAAAAAHPCAPAAAHFPARLLIVACLLHSVQAVSPILTQLPKMS
jgi:hypothetical protein